MFLEDETLLKIANSPYVILSIDETDREAAKSYSERD